VRLFWLFPGSRIGLWLNRLHNPNLAAAPWRDVFIAGWAGLRGAVTLAAALSIPLAVATAAPALGRALIALGLDRLPEETLPPPELRALELPAIELSQRGR